MIHNKRQIEWLDSVERHMGANGFSTVRMSEGGEWAVLWERVIEVEQGSWCIVVSIDANVRNQVYIEVLDLGGNVRHQQAGRFHRVLWDVMDRLGLKHWRYDPKAGVVVDMTQSL